MVLGFGKGFLEGIFHFEYSSELNEKGYFEEFRTGKRGSKHMQYKCGILCKFSSTQTVLNIF